MIEQDLRSFEAVRQRVSARLQDRLGPPRFDPVPLELSHRRLPHNQEAAAVVVELLRWYQNLKDLVIGSEVCGISQMGKEYGIDPNPLFNGYAPKPEFRRIVRGVFNREHQEIPSCHKAIVESLEVMKREKTLGRATGAKMAFVKEVTGSRITKLQPNELWSSLIDLRNRTLELLDRQRARLDAQHPKVDDVLAMQRRIRHDVSSDDVLYYGFKELARDLVNRTSSIDQFLLVFADEIVGMMLEEAPQYPLPNKPPFPTYKDISIRYVPRDREYLMLGDHFGDCTANRPKCQADARVTNIHWTTYGWILDPYYQIAIVFVGDEPVVKAHFLPLLIDGQTVLMVDAIEAVTKLRDVIASRPNPFLKKSLFGRRNEIFQALLAFSRQLGSAMGVEAVLMDRFSNADWIRQETDSLPGMVYHVNDVEKPFQWTFAERIVNDLGGFEDARVVGEVQAKNTALFDQGLRDGYKEAAVIQGQMQTTMHGCLRGP